MEKIGSRIERFIRTHDGKFESLALDLFAYQFEKNLAYRAFCEAQQVSLETVLRWEDIPAVPVHAFKSTELITFPAGRASAIFESSRTTGQTPSRHFLKDLLYYETAIVKSFEQWVLPDQAKLPFLILTPPPGEAPRSSLTWMLDTVKRRFSPSGEYFVQRGRLDDMRLAHALQRFEKANQPVLLLGTTLAFLSFFDVCDAQKNTFPLPDGSRLVDTGGMKATKRQITRQEFVDKVNHHLHIPAIQCINEYGMCEMSSQFYGRGVSTVLQGPPWVRTRLVDGCLRHYDLANVDSVLAIQTEDLGRLENNRTFELLGRASGAEPKGCSLAAESF